MKNSILSSAFLLAFTVAGFAQSLSPTVISSSGGFYSNGSGMLSATVGEPVVETYSTASVILTQGFQQPEDFNVSVNDIDAAASGITAGPNPTHGEVQLMFSTLGNLKVRISVYDVAGKVLWRRDEEKLAGNNVVSLNLSALAAGDYFLECVTAGAKDSFAKKITVVK